MVDLNLSYNPELIRKRILPRPLLTGLLLLFSDVVVLLAALWSGGQLWQTANPALTPLPLVQLWPLLLLFPVTYALLGLYPAEGVHPVEELRQLSTATTAIYLFALLFSLLVSQGRFVAQGAYWASWCLALLLVPLGRALLRHLFAKRSWWGVPVLILGAGQTARFVIQRLQDHPGLGLKPIACFDDDVLKHGDLLGVGVVGTLAAAEQLAKTHHIKHTLVAMPGLQPSQLSRVVRKYAGLSPNLIIVPDMFGLASLNVRAKDLSGILGLHARQNLLVWHNRVFKRVIDLAFVVPVAVLFFLPLLLCCLWISGVSKGTPFYAQTREGFKGKAIKVWKLRTMHFDAEKLLERHLAQDPQAKAEWERFYKLRHDPRLIFGASVLRKLSLDELPQLWNVVTGDMSFVGPRPFPYYHLDNFDEDFRALRTGAKPGITGLWQVSVRSEGDLSVQKHYDSYYIQNWSLWLDLYVLARTPWAVLTGKGAY